MLKEVKTNNIIVVLVLFWLCFAMEKVKAQEHSFQGYHDNSELHFSHPLVAESPTPDTKVRFDYFFASVPGKDGHPGVDRHTLRLEAEYAFTPWLSLEVNAPYTFLRQKETENTDRIGNLEVALKYANFALAERGMLLGGGIEFGLPTGNDNKGIGSNHVIQVEPFLDFGYQHRDFQIVSFLSFGIPFNKNGQDEADVELGWNLSVLYHLIAKVEALVELDGQHIIGGGEDGFFAVNISPEIKVIPFGEEGLQLGVGISLPLAEDKEFHAMSVFSIFYHF